MNHCFFTTIFKYFLFFLDEKRKRWKEEEEAKVDENRDNICFIHS